MLIALIAAVAVACHSRPITLAEAKQLVLAAPGIRAAVVQRNAHPFFEYVQTSAGGWRFDVNARDPCAGPGPCSALLGHYGVTRQTSEVENLDVGMDGQIVSSPRLRALQRKFRRCG